MNALTLRNALLAVLCFFLTSGCGDSQAFLAGGGTPVLSGGEVFGRVLLDRPAAGATVQVTDLVGNPLSSATGVVDSTGNFLVPVSTQSLPPEFQVRVDMPAGSQWDLPLLVNVKNGSGAFCNVLTTAAALHRQRNALSQEAAEAWVRRTFAIPEGVLLGSGVDESRRSFFRHSAFLERALGQGGVSAYLSGLLENSRVSGQFGEVIAGIITSIALDLAADEFQDILGKIAQALGFNIGNQQVLEEGLEELSSIESSLRGLEDQVNSDFMAMQNQLANVEEAATLLEVYENISQALSTPVDQIDEQNVTLLALGNSNTITNQPRLPLVGFQDFATALSNFNTETTLAEISDLVLGQQQLGLLEVYRRLISLRMGVVPSGSTVFAYTPFLSNALYYDSYESIVKYYANAQILGLNLLVENANLALSPAIVSDARVTLAKLRTDLALQGQAAGFPLASDQYFAIPEYAFQTGLSQPAPTTPSATIYYTQVMAPVSNTQSLVTVSEGFQAPGYPSGWRLPSFEELTFLRNVALEKNPSNPQAGLALLGFQLPTNWDGNLWYLYAPAPGQAATVYSWNFNNGAQTVGAPLSVASYIEIHSQGFDSSASYTQLVAAGFRPTTTLTLQLVSGGTEIQAFLGTQNVTEYCAFSCSGPRQLELNDTGTNSIALLWHPGTTPLTAQTVTATMPGMNAADGTPKELRATLRVEVPSPAPTRAMTSILLTPSNTVLTNPSAGTVFKAIAFYDDRTIADVSQQVTWSLELPNGFPYPPGAATINGSIPGILTFTQFPVAQPRVVVRATLGSLSGTTQLEVSEAIP